MEFLDFEVPVKEILEQIDKCKSIENESDVDVTKTFNLLQKKLVETKKGIYGNLSAWQKVQLSRHPNRPYTLDYINNIFQEEIQFDIEFKLKPFDEAKEVEDLLYAEGINWDKEYVCPFKEKYGNNIINVSLSHTDNNAIAYLIMESK